MTNDPCSLSVLFRTTMEILLDNYCIDSYVWEQSDETDYCSLLIHKEYDSGFDILVTVSKNIIEITVPAEVMTARVIYRPSGSNTKVISQKALKDIEDMLSSKVFIHEFIGTDGFINTQLIRSIAGRHEILRGEGIPPPDNYKIAHEHRMNNYLRRGRPYSI